MLKYLCYVLLDYVYLKMHILNPLNWLAFKT